MTKRMQKISHMKIELDKVFIELLTTNIVLVTAKNGVIIETEDVKTIKEHNLKITEGKGYVLIVDARLYTSISIDARELMTSASIEQNRKATAIIIYDLPQRIIGNFYISINKPSVPTKLFNNKESALKWVKKYLEK